MKKLSELMAKTKADSPKETPVESKTNTEDAGKSL